MGGAWFSPGVWDSFGCLMMWIETSNRSSKGNKDRQGHSHHNNRMAPERRRIPTPDPSKVGPGLLVEDDEQNG